MLIITDLEDYYEYIRIAKQRSDYLWLYHDQQKLIKSLFFYCSRSNTNPYLYLIKTEVSSYGKGKKYHYSINPRFQDSIQSILSHLKALCMTEHNKSPNDLKMLSK